MAIIRFDGAGGDRADTDCEGVGDVEGSIGRTESNGASEGEGALEVEAMVDRDGAGELDGVREGELDADGDGVRFGEGLFSFIQTRFSGFFGMEFLSPGLEISSVRAGGVPPFLKTQQGSPSSAPLLTPSPSESAWQNSTV